MDYCTKIRSILISGLCAYHNAAGLDLDQTSEMIDELLTTGDLTEDDIYYAFFKSAHPIRPAPNVTEQKKKELFIDKIKHLIPVELICVPTGITYSINSIDSKDLRQYFFERIMTENALLLQHVGVNSFADLNNFPDILRCYMDVVEDSANKILDYIFCSRPHPTIIKLICEDYIIPSLDTITNFRHLLALCRDIDDKQMQDQFLNRLTDMIVADHNKEHIYGLIGDCAYGKNEFTHTLIDAYEDVFGEIVLGTDEYPFYKYNGLVFGDRNINDKIFINELYDRIKFTDDAKLFVKYGFWNHVKSIYPKIEYYDISNTFTQLCMYNQVQPTDVKFANNVIQKVLSHIKSNII